MIALLINIADEHKKSFTDYNFLQRRRLRMKKVSRSINFYVQSVSAALSALKVIRDYHRTLAYRTR